MLKLKRKKAKTLRSLQHQKESQETENQLRSSFQGSNFYRSFERLNNEIDAAKTYQGIFGRSSLEVPNVVIIESKKQSLATTIRRSDGAIDSFGVPA